MSDFQVAVSGKYTFMQDMSQRGGHWCDFQLASAMRRERSLLGGSFVRGGQKNGISESYFLYLQGFDELESCDDEVIYKYSCVFSGRKVESLCF